ncbi:putative tail length tape measure protein from putative prophage [Escherichia coli]|uniref:Putative tail length tape measure protein from putative prophage n=1 Tax=Escherichia coli TaxID=562 RepID=A0A376P9P1_ECOLX|nr:putative tail length tape measure protein from putative prophage [Escherichia coli]
MRRERQNRCLQWHSAVPVMQLATFCTTGKLNFKSFTSSLLSDMARIMAQMAMMQAVKGVGSLFGFTTNADGGVYQSC